MGRQTDHLKIEKQKNGHVRLKKHFANLKQFNSEEYTASKTIQNATKEAKGGVGQKNHKI